MLDASTNRVKEATWLRFTIRRAITALALGAAAAASLVLAAPAAAPHSTGERPSTARPCDSPSFEREFPTCHEERLGHVDRRADSPGGNPAWWINNRNESIKSETRCT